MGEPVFSPDGQFMWAGDGWIPAPPSSTPQPPPQSDTPARCGNCGTITHPSAETCPACLAPIQIPVVAQQPLQATQPVITQPTMNTKQRVGQFLNQIRNLNIDSTSFAPEIPEKKITNSLKKHNDSTRFQPNTVLMMIDDTVWGSGKDGLVVSSRGIHWKEIWEKPGSMLWSSDVSCITGFSLEKKTLYASFGGIPTKIMVFTGVDKDALFTIVGILNEMAKVINCNHPEFQRIHGVF